MTDDLAAAIAQLNRKLSCWKDEVARQMDRAERAEALAAKRKAALESLREPFSALLIAGAVVYDGIPDRSRPVAPCGPELAVLITALAAALAEEESYD